MIDPQKRELTYAVTLSAGLVVGVGVYFIDRDLAFSAGAIALFAVYLAFVLTHLFRADAQYLRTHARQADLPVTVMFVVVLTVVATAAGSLFLLINEKGSPDPLKLTLALLAVALSWCTVHAMYAVHYAHLCWLDDDAEDASTDDTPREKAQGLDFPGEDQPGGIDFLYFSVVIGMTAQTADVDTTTVDIRRIVIFHSLLAYLFNTVIVAAAVNLAVSLGQ